MKKVILHRKKKTIANKAVITKEIAVDKDKKDMDFYELRGASGWDYD